MKATREQKIDFIYHTFKFKGGMTKKKLRSYSDNEIDRFIEEYPKHFERYMKQPKVIHYLWQNDMQSGDVYAENVVQAREILLKENLVAEIIVEKKGHHLCKYCKGITVGSKANILCDDCQKTFGHYTYDEL